MAASSLLRSPSSRKALLTKRTRIALALIGVTIAIGGSYVWYLLRNPLALDASPPAVIADLPDTMPPAAPSIIDAPVAYDVSAAVDSLERAVPREFGDLTRRIQAGSNTRAHFAFVVAREPFRVRVNGTTISISTDVEYEGRVWYRPFIGPELSAACGTAGVPRPRVRATLVSSARLTPDWQLRTRTRVARLEPVSTEPRDRCRITIFRIDVTNRVIDATRRLLEQNVEKFDRNVARWNSRERFERLWHTLQRPIRFTDSVYMLINPYSAQLGSIGAVRDTLVAQVRLIASPRVVTGARPRDADHLTDIPPLQKADSGSSGSHVQMDARFTYSVATELLQRALVGRSIRQGSRRIRVADVQLFGIGGGRVALGVQLAGAVKGRLYFTGTPSIDRANRQVHVPDLDYDVGSVKLLVRGFEWMKGVDIRDFLRERARLPDSAALGKLIDLAERGTNRTLAPGVDLGLRIERAEGTGVLATTTDIRVRAVADAEMKLTISRGPAMPRPRLPAANPSTPKDSPGKASVRKDSARKAPARKDSARKAPVRNDTTR